MRAIQLEIGREFGRLKVQRLIKENNRREWECLCSCGNITRQRANNLTSNAVVSCGCNKIEKAIQRVRKHGLSGTPEHESWMRMIERCENKNTPYYKHYGGRGIRVCAKWRYDFEAFLTDVGIKPTPKHELDRYPNNDGNYEPGNCRWATRSQQLNNLRCNFRITVDGVTKTATEWSRISGIHPATIKSRIKNNIDPKQAVFGEKWSQQKSKGKK